MAKTTDPFDSLRPFNPPAFRGGSPLAENARQFAPRINVLGVEEHSRSETIPADILSGNLTPTFRPVLTPAPFEPTTPIPTTPKPQAGPK